MAEVEITGTLIGSSDSAAIRDACNPLWRVGDRTPLSEIHSFLKAYASIYRLYREYPHRWPLLYLLSNVRHQIQLLLKRCLQVRTRSAFG